MVLPKALTQFRIPWEWAEGQTAHLRRRAMNETGRVQPSITAYALSLNGLIGEDDKMDATSLRNIAMPNRDGFVLEARPDTEDSACMSNCRQGRAVSITMDSRRFVEPGSASGTSQPE